MKSFEKAFEKRASKIVKERKSFLEVSRSLRSLFKRPAGRKN